MRGCGVGEGEDAPPDYFAIGVYGKMSFLFMSVCAEQCATGPFLQPPPSPESIMARLRAHNCVYYDHKLFPDEPIICDRYFILRLFHDASYLSRVRLKSCAWRRNLMTTTPTTSRTNDGRAGYGDKRDETLFHKLRVEVYNIKCDISKLFPATIHF